MRSSTRLIRPVRPGDRPEAERISDRLVAARNGAFELLGLADDECVEVLTAQIVESQRRNRFFEYLTEADLGERSRSPASESFDPLRAAVMWARDGAYDEALWMVFLYTHFGGKNRFSGYGYARDVYGRLDDATWYWDWTNTSHDVDAFRQWLFENQDAIKARNRPGGFGNHRKYESLDGWSYAGTGSVVESYVEWIGPEGHASRVGQIITGKREGERFDSLFDSMDEVQRFGRTARFDYLMTASKLRLIDAKPSHAHLKNATGPVRGVKLLVTGATDGQLSSADQREAVNYVHGQLDIGFDVIEDALCNWQKSPGRFTAFRG